MIYLWEHPKQYIEGLIADYIKEDKSDRLALREGRRVNENQFITPALFDLDANVSTVLQFDCVANNASSPLVNERVRDIFMRLAPDDVQFFETEITCDDGILRNYSLLNITHSVRGMDHGKSEYKKMAETDLILSFQNVSYKYECLGNHHIARDADYLGHIIVSAELKQAFEAANITGYSFEVPEEVYARIRGEIE